MKTYQDIKSALAALTALSAELENAYLENGGEVTAETEELEAQIAAISDLLEGEGIDTLGRWLKAKEDELATYKAEKAVADRKIKSVQNTMDFVKEIIGQVLRATGREKVKGAFYTFSQYTSTKTSYKADAVDADYLELATEAARKAGLPDYIDVALKTTATRIADWSVSHEYEGANYLVVDSTETCKFTKPRKAEA